jgi:beta-phosphoglucomutase-like phosphatase (HAD superfamily)
MRFTGGIFDVDGVLLDTPHERAWREALAQLMEGTDAPWHALMASTSYRPGAFTSAVYQEYVAGKPREAGAKAALDYFQIPDPDGARTRQYAVVKQAILERLAAEGDFHAYDDAVRFLLSVKAAGVRICAASSSKNADAFLCAISVGSFCAREGLQYPFVKPETTLLDLLDADVDGSDVPQGKPAPDLFLAAVQALGDVPVRCFVVEDAVVGIQAAKAGGMYGIGVARHADVALLQAAHADLVVERLDTIDVHALLSDATVEAGDVPPPQL